MKLNKEQWSNQDYNEFINYLLSNVDLEYQKFHSKIVFNDESIILGVRTPLLKKIALEISKGNYKAFIKLNKHKYYEEIIIHGLIIGYLKEDFSSAIKLFDQFLNYIDNWAICDIICSNMKILKKNQAIGFEKILEYLKSSNKWIVRVGLVLLIMYYVNDKYVNSILEIVKTINSDEYYVKMATSWLISICYIKYPSETYELLKAKKLDKFIQNKAISKIRDSYRVSKIDKDNLLEFKI